MSSHFWLNQSFSISSFFGKDRVSLKKCKGFVPSYFVRIWFINEYILFFFFSFFPLERKIKLLLILLVIHYKKLIIFISIHWFNETKTT